MIGAESEQSLTASGRRASGGPYAAAEPSSSASSSSTPAAAALSPHKARRVRLAAPDFLLKTYSAASQRKLMENSGHSSQGGEGCTKTFKRAPPQSLKESNQQQSSSLRTVRTHSMRYEGSWNGSTPSLTYFHEEEHDTCINIQQNAAIEVADVTAGPDTFAEDGRGKSPVADSVSSVEFNPSTGATGSAYDASGPLALPPTQDGGGGGRRQSHASVDPFGDRFESRRRKSKIPALKGLWSSVCSWRTFWINVSTFRDLCGRLVNDERVQLAIVLLIVVNALMMGMETFEFVEDNPEATSAFALTDRVFLILFTIESAFQFIYHGLNLFTDGWLLFDVLIIVLSWSFESLQVVRAFRIFRCFRLITRLTVLKNLVLSIFAVAPSMTAIVSLLVLILYIYAVMCTTLFGDLYPEYTDEDYFSTLFLSLFTLFSMMTLEWAGVVRQVMAKYYWSCFLFSTFLILTGFILYSLIIAVVCDAVKVTEHQEEAKRHLEEKEEARQRLFALEHRVADLAQHQGVIVEQLHLALKELARVDVDSNGDDDGDDDEIAADQEASPHLYCHDDDQPTATPEDSTSLTNSLDLTRSWNGGKQSLSSPRLSPRSRASVQEPYVSSPRQDRSGRSLARLSLPELSPSGRSHSRSCGVAEDSPEGDLGSTSHAVVLALLEEPSENDNDDEDANDSDTATEKFVDDESKTR